MDPPYRVTFGDETFLDVEYDPMKMTEQMEKFEPGCTSCLQSIQSESFEAD